MELGSTRTGIFMRRRAVPVGFRGFSSVLYVGRFQYEYRINRRSALKNSACGARLQTPAYVYNAPVCMPQSAFLICVTTEMWIHHTHHATCGLLLIARCALAKSRVQVQVR